MSEVLFPFNEYWWFYLAFSAAVLVLLVLDLGVFHRNAHRIGIREAAAWSVAWVCLALLFCAALYGYARWHVSPDAAREVALEFLSGYLVEYSLSVDNIFIFVLVFNYFAIPAEDQHRVLFYGIIGALGFRAAFITLGAVLMQLHWVVLLFGAFLILTGLKMAFAPQQGLDPERNPAIRLFRRFVPVTPTLAGHQFFVRIHGAMHATPLFITLLFIEITDIIFAVDSVPAIYGLTNEPLVVFTSNVFAILGLRALYFILADMFDRFHLLRYGLAVVLVFVGLKMIGLDAWFGGKLPTGLSLGTIAAAILLSIIASLLFPPKRPDSA